MRRYTEEQRERHRALTKRHYQANRDYYKAKAHNNVPITKAYVAEYLATHPCVDCDESDVVVLDFDHVRGVKLAEISKMTHSNSSLELVKEEILKCDVRCANCHRRQTCSRRSMDRMPRYERGDLLVQVQPGAPL